MYNLLIVDDEPEVVSWLYDLFLESKFLELEVYKAYTAHEALVLMDKVKIDIVISDIKMPGMNGLQLIEKIRSNWPKCQVVFLTGYREFDYVYTAVKSGAVRYLLKTEGDQKILDAVKSCISDLEKSLLEEEILSKAKQQIELVIPFFKEKFVVDLLTGIIPDSDLTQERFEELKISLAIDRPFILFMARFDHAGMDRSYSQKLKSSYSFKQIILEYLPKDLRPLCTINEQQDIICILQPMDNPSPATLDQPNWERAFTLIKGSLEYIQDVCKRTLNRSVSFSVFDAPFNIGSLINNYNCLKNTFSRRIGIGSEMILLEKGSEDANAGLAANGSDSDIESYRKLGKVKVLENFLELGQKEEYFTLLNEICKNLSTEKSKSYNPALEVYYNVSMVLLGYINRSGLAGRIDSNIGLYKLTRADEHPSWSEAVEYLCRLSGNIFEIQHIEEQKRATDVVDAVKKYIASNLSQELTLVRLSDYVHFNPSYLSRLFKQVSGINLSDYILNARIEKAKELLDTSTLKINEISLEVGYEYSHSFARFFKNATGMSPLDYRASHLK